MKNLSLMTLGLCVAFAFNCVAADKPAKAERQDRRAELIKKYDKNGDGKLDEKERAEMKKDQAKKGKRAKGGEKPAAPAQK